MTLFFTIAFSIVVAPMTVGTSTVEAQSTLVNEVSADVKGTLAGGILGAELGALIPAIFVNAGVREFDEAWAYVLFPALGAAGGAVGGYFGIEEPSRDASGQLVSPFPEVAVALLAVGLTLIVPTVVAVLALTTYDPSRDGASAGDEESDSDDEASSESAVRRVLAGGPGLLRFADGELLLGIPMVHSQNTYTDEERASMRLDARQDINVPVVSGSF